LWSLAFAFTEIKVSEETPAAGAASWVVGRRSRCGQLWAAVGVADGTKQSVLATDDRSWNVVLYDIDGDGTAGDSGDDFDEMLYRILANDIYSAINEQGDI
jgi:hypothetical protein